METRTIESIRSNPAYHTLERTRSTFAWTLSAIMLVIYYGFILVVAFDPTFLAQKIGGSDVMTLAFPVGIGVILSAIILTGIYVWRANSHFDALTRKIVETTR